MFQSIFGFLFCISFSFATWGQNQNFLDSQKAALRSLIVEAIGARSELVFNQGLRKLAKQNFKQGLAANEHQALDQLIEIVDGEKWTLNSQYKFNLAESLIRNQGLATDENNHFWFSGTYSLEKVHSKTNAASLLKAFPFPKECIAHKDDHIGDIDYYDGTIYAPVEDGQDNYKNPYVVLYDAEKLTVKKYFRLPVAPQAEGVPWIALEPAKNRAFSAMYYNVTKINVFDLQTFALIGEISLSKVIHNWQGAKVHNGFLYATEDADPTTIGKHLLKINLETGTVMEVGTLPEDVTELEGLAFSTVDGEAEIDALALIRHGTNKISRALSTRAYLEMYRRAKPSLREDMRQIMERPNSF